MTRRTLPLNALEAFLVTARHLNLTHAARALYLTQGAVSRKIATLEAWFGFALFERHARGLRLTPQGSALLPDLQNAWDQLMSAADQARQQHNVIRLKAPTCAIRWLVPKLMQLEKRLSDVQVTLTTTTDHDVNFKTEPYDAAIIFGAHKNPGFLLFDEALTPVLSPTLMPDVPSTPDALSALTFLHPTRDKTDWSLWLAQQSTPRPVMRKNQHFDTMDLAISAAIQGFGVAIADERLVAEDLRAGRLIRPFPQCVKTGASYRLVLRDAPQHSEFMAAFVAQLLTPDSHDDASPGGTAPGGRA